MQKQFILASIFLIFVSCERASMVFDNISSNKQAQIDKANSYMLSQPDSSILITDQLLYYPQNKINNSLKLKILQLRQQAFYNMRKMDSVLKTGELIRSLADTMNDSLAMAKSLLFIKGTIDFKDIKKAADYLPGAIYTFEKNNMDYERAFSQNLYSVVLIEQGEVNKALSNLIDALETMEKVDSTQALFNICTNIANTYISLKSNEKALEYYKKANVIANELNDTIKQAVALMNLGGFYMNQKDSSAYYYNKSNQLLKSSEKYGLKLRLQYNIALMELNNGNYDKAAAVFEEIQQIGLTLNQIEAVARAKKSLADIYLKKNNLSKAIVFSNEAIQLFDSLKMTNEALSVMEFKVAALKQSGKYKEAIDDKERADKMRDSLFAVEKQIAVHELETKYQTEKKELENEALKNRLWNIKMYILIFAIATFVFFVLWRQRVKLIHEKAISYEILMAKYRADREIHENLVQTKYNQVQANAIIEDGKTSHEQSLITQLINYFNTEKPYLNSKLKLEDVAIALNSSVKDINILLKENHYNSFFAFVNKYRVEEARRLFEVPENNSLKLDIIAGMAGFGAKQTFYSAFMQVTGVNPGYYRKNILSEPFAD